MKRQKISSGISKKTVINLSSAEFAQREVILKAKWINTSYSQHDFSHHENMLI